MDWKKFFDNLGMNGTRWQWRMMRYERNLKMLLRGDRLPAGQGIQVSMLLVYVNLALFTLMVLHGMALGLGSRPLMRPPVELLVAWGGQFWPLVLANGQWWRCLSYAFTHGGLIHLGFNMMVLYQIGPLIEREIGAMRFLVLYTASALCGTFLGYFWHPLITVVGASGALFGIIGFAISFYHRIGGPIALERRNFMLRWALFAFVFGFLVGADNAAHLGGCLAGLAFGYVLPLGVRGHRASAKLFTILGTVCALAMAASILGMLTNLFF